MRVEVGLNHSTPTKFAGLWLGGDLGLVEQASLLSFASRFQNTILFSYSPEAIPSDQFEVRDAREILSENQIFRNPGRKGGFAGFSNLFRYALLNSGSYTWFDLDVVCLNWPYESEEYLFGFEDLNFVNGAVLRAPSGSHFVNNLQSHASQFPKERLRWGQLGPKLITQIATDMELLPIAKPPSVFYPVSPRMIALLFDPKRTNEAENILRSSWAVHLWNEVLKNVAPELRVMMPPEKSFLGNAFSALNLNGSQGHLDARWVKDLSNRLRLYHSVFGRAKRRIEDLRETGKF